MFGLRRWKAVILREESAVFQKRRCCLNYVIYWLTKLPLAENKYLGAVLDTEFLGAYFKPGQGTCSTAKSLQYFLMGLMDVKSYWRCVVGCLFVFIFLITACYHVQSSDPVCHDGWLFLFSLLTCYLQFLALLVTHQNYLLVIVVGNYISLVTYGVFLIPFSGRCSLQTMCYY